MWWGVPAPSLIRYGVLGLKTLKTPALDEVICCFLVDRSVHSTHERDCHM